MMSKQRTFVRAFGLARSVLALAFVCAGVAACSADKLAPGKACLAQSDCPSPLACSFGRCHVACREARDCGAGQTCVISATGNVCLLVEERSCALNSMCPTGLFCAQDLQCRSQCEEDRDCPTATQICVLPDQVCAESADTEDGHLIKGSGGGAGGVTGTGGSGVGGTGSSTGGAPGAGGNTGAGGAPNCSQAETMPNDTIEQAGPYVIGTSVTACLDRDPDHDYYRFTVPTDPAGGYVQVAVTNVSADNSVEVRILAASDTAQLVATATPTRGQSNFTYAAVTPGASYLLDVTPYSFGNPGSYVVTITYKAIPDTYEPNDTRFDAKPIPLGTPINAYLFAGYPTGNIADDDDYYKVTLAAGAVTVTLDVFPTNASPHIWLYDDLGGLVKEMAQPTLGAGASISAMATKAGDYYVRVANYSAPGKQAGNGVDLPDNFTRTYRLAVRQP